LSGRDLVTLADDPRNLGAHLFHGDVERLENAGRKALLLAQQAEQDVFRADVVVLERPRFILGEDDDLARSFCESLEHSVTFLPPMGGANGFRFSEWLIVLPPAVAPPGFTRAWAEKDKT
jgi:hypothetical protein